MTKEEKMVDFNPEWFGGNEQAVAIFKLLERIAHTWDDLLDRDKKVEDGEINWVFKATLLYLPSIPLYQEIFAKIAPMWSASFAAYETANFFEKQGEDHGLELAHMLRYMSGMIITYLVQYCVGPEKAAEFLPKVWKCIACERFEDYRREHLRPLGEEL